MWGRMGALGGEGPAKDDPVLVVGVTREVGAAVSHSANGEALQGGDDKGACKG